MREIYWSRVFGWKYVDGWTMTGLGLTRPTAVASNRDPIGKVKPFSLRWCRCGAWSVSGKHQDCTGVLNWEHDNQVFENWIFPIHGHDELLLNCNGYRVKADANEAIRLRESKEYSLFIICGDVRTFRVIEDEWKRR
jgi:hypothetical protein